MLAHPWPITSVRTMASGGFPRGSASVLGAGGAGGAGGPGGARGAVLNQYEAPQTIGRASRDRAGRFSWGLIKGSGGTRAR
jgi:hypothetical protein